MKQGILFLNFGGPRNQDEVRPCLYRLFANRAIIDLPTPLRQFVAYMIVRKRLEFSKECYRRIGGGSPQRCWTEAQSLGLARKLGDPDQRVAFGMLISEPFIREALEDLRAWGAERLVLLPAFPQYSTTTTGACFEEVQIALRKMRWKPAEIREVRRWNEHPAYVRLLRKTLDEKIAIAEAERAKENATDPIHVLFSAHSLPVKVIQRGDPYEKDVNATVAATARGLEHPWSLAYQSRNDTLPWLEPYTEDEIKRLADAGIRRVVVVAVSFISDHIETLYELDQLYAEMARAHGITHYYRARAFNDDPEFQDVLRTILNDSGVLS